MNNGDIPTKSVAVRIAAAALLLAAILIGWRAADRLVVLHAPPESAIGYGIAFVLAAAMAFVAAKLTGRELPAPAPGEEKCGRLRRVLLPIGLVALLGTWILQSRPSPPPSVLVIWAVALVAIPLSFPRVVRASAADPGRRWMAWTAAIAAVLLVVAAWARLSALGRLPPTFSGDEANQVRDAREWWTGRSRTDPFGTGWIGTIRLGMLPAGVLRTPIEGPRLPYAVAGTLSVAAAGAAAGLVAGPVAAVGCLAFLAFAPHHVHFGRLASVQILDSFFATVTVALLLAARRSGSSRFAAFAGVFAGLSLYGYAGGRVVPALFLAAAVFLVFDLRQPAPRRRRIALALGAGFAAAAGPNLRFAVGHFADWNSRFNQVSIFQEGWLPAETQRLGSVWKVLASQLESGTLGLLHSEDYTSWFTGYPLLGPTILIGAAIAGFGWIAGRRLGFETMLVGLLAAGNLAGVVLTSGAPSVQRISSLLPALAILGGGVFAGLLSFVPETASGRVPLRAAAATLCAGLLVVTQIRGYPLDSDPYAGYGGPHAALAQRAAEVLRLPRFRGRPVYLHGWRFVDSSFPGFEYFLPQTRFHDDDPAMTGYTESSFPPGIHLFSSEWVAAGKEWRDRLGLSHGIPLGDPASPARDVGYLFVVLP